MFGEPLRMVPAIVSSAAEKERSRSESGPRGRRVTRGSGVLVPVAVVQVGIMRVLVHDPRVLMRVAMRLSGRIISCMPVPMVGVVHVPVLVLQRLMQVLVLMRLREMQVDQDPHQSRGTEKGQCRRLAE